MFHPIEIPFGCTMLFNVVDLKPGVSIEDVELLLGEMCNVVKNNYGDDNGGFIGGQVFRNAGFKSLAQPSISGNRYDSVDGSSPASNCSQNDSTFESAPWSDSLE